MCFGVALAIPLDDVVELPFRPVCLVRMATVRVEERVRLVTIEDVVRIGVDVFGMEAVRRVVG